MIYIQHLYINPPIKVCFEQNIVPKYCFTFYCFVFWGFFFYKTLNKILFYVTIDDISAYNYVTEAVLFDLMSFRLLDFLVHVNSTNSFRPMSFIRLDFSNFHFDFLNYSSVGHFGKKFNLGHFVPMSYIPSNFQFYVTSTFEHFGSMSFRPSDFPTLCYFNLWPFRCFVISPLRS